MKEFLMGFFCFLIGIGLTLGVENLVGKQAFQSISSPHTYTISMGAMIDYNQDSIRELFRTLAIATPDDTIVLDYNSWNGGGNAYVVLDFLKIIRAKHLHTIALVKKPIASAAAMIAGLTDEVDLYPHAFLLNHHYSESMTKEAGPKYCPHDYEMDMWVNPVFQISMQKGILTISQVHDIEYNCATVYTDNETNQIKVFK